MKSFRLLVLIAGVVLVFGVVTACGHAAGSNLDDEFSVKEYNDFHDLLRPLQHEALPKKEFARIRAKSGELVKLGDAIVKLGVPAGTPEAKAEAFKTELKKFQDGLSKLSADVKDGTDEQLGKSFSSVHDLFEELAEMLPRK